jgi:oligopeptide/dipeptide ABC transporter ATP-binding protein
MTTPLVEARGLTKKFPVGRTLLGRPRAFVHAVTGVDVTLVPGETLALVGESGCGKSTLGRLLLRLIEPTSGDVRFEGRSLGELRGRELRALRRSMQIVFQDPYGSLNPRMRVEAIVGEGLLIHRIGTRAERRAKVRELLDLVGLSPEAATRYPHEFSGGQRQRIGIARALSLRPKFIVCDEAVSALDVSIQAQVINLLMDLREQFGLAYLFVAHDLSVVKHVSDRVAVMYVGRIVEVADTERLFTTPRHPYTEALLSAVPKPDPRLRTQRIVLEGDVADAANPPPGCYFHPRCSYAVPACRVETPRLEAIAPGHLVACHRARELTLRGVAV